MENNLLEALALVRQKEELASIIECNTFTQEFGLVLSAEDAKMLVESRNDSLKTYQRVEFGKGILDKLIYQFCDSEYINQSNYMNTLIELQDAFYLYKNESLDLLTDDELLNFMKEQFENICFGDVDYLTNTCLERFSRAVRAGYKEHQKTGGTKVYDLLDEEQRWDKDLYLQVLTELCWR